MSNRYAVNCTAWRAALWWLAAPLVAAIIVMLPHLVSPNPFTMPSLESVTHANGKWVLEDHDSGKYLFRYDGRLYRSSCMGASTDQVFREDCDSILSLKGQELEGTLSEGRLLVLEKEQPIFQVEAIGDKQMTRPPSTKTAPAVALAAPR
jgi:hypothetical protein